MRRDPHPLRDRWLDDAAAAIGVTRVARLTGLDRTGVEVASAVRPAGHVLQVTNGKGATFAEAARGAVMEAVELWAAEHAAPGPHGTADEVRRAAPGVEVLSATALAPDADPAWDALALGWREAAVLGRGGRALVPAAAVSCPPPSAPLLGPAVVRWTSNGMGAHRDRAAAVLHGLLEAVERDQLARALPEGFTAEALRVRLVAPGSLARAAPRTAARVAALARRGFRVHLLDCGAGAGLPVAAALLVDPDGAPVPVAAGYACRLDRDAALSAALLEACQSRATEIHGAREDVLVGDRDQAAPLAALCAAIRPRLDAGALPSARAPSPARAIGAIVRRLEAAGLGPAVAADLPAPEGVHAVQVVVPGLLLSELL
jgi:ribosomal protein S12 methylthiotransferase accessory factor